MHAVSIKSMQNLKKKREETTLSCLALVFLYQAPSIITSIEKSLLTSNDMILEIPIPKQ